MTEKPAMTIDEKRKKLEQIIETLWYCCDSYYSPEMEKAIEGLRALIEKEK